MGGLRRWWTDLPLRRKGLAVVAIPLVPLLAFAAAALLVSNRERQAQASIMRALRVKGELATVFGLMADAETGVRGYLLTRHPDSRRVYEDATRPLAARQNRLRELVAGDAAQLQRFDRIQALQRQRPLAALLEYAERANQSPANPVELLAKSRATMAQLRGELSRMQDHEDRQLADRVRLASSARDQLQAVTAGGVALAIFASVAAVTVFTNGVSRRVDRLREDAAHLARGEDLPVREQARDEVGEVSAALQHASALLRQRDEQVREHVRAVEQTRAELDVFFSVSLDMLCIAGLDGRFRRLNKAWETVLGWSREELLASPFIDFVHPDEVASTIEETSRLGEGGVTLGFENRYRCADGSYRWLSWKATADLSRGLIYAAARDITEQKQAAQALKTHLAELGALNQELEAFSYSVSHDLRAPLRHISGFAALLEQRLDGALDPEAARYLETITGAASRMGVLIDDLLSFSRMGRTHLQRGRISTNALVADVLKDLQAEAGDRQVEWVVQPLPDVDADKSMLRLALVNLLSNALKYTRTKPHARIEVGTAPSAADELVFYVRDNGVGFDMKYADKLFGVFQRLHRADEFEGTGVGLANVRRIVHRHGGRTWAEATPGAGATFFFSLPRIEDAATHDRVA